MTRRALVTGAAGFIGRNFVRALAAGGWRVDGFDAVPFSIRGHDRQAMWADDARRWFRRDDPRPGKYDLVVHCAAVVGGRKMIDGQPLTVASNLVIDAEMFQWALRARPGRVVYFSSSAVYPVVLQEKESRYGLLESAVDPAYPELPDAMYGWCKLTGELLAQHAEAEGLRVHVFRPMSGFGEDQSLDYPFPSFIDRAARREDPFAIWGSGRQVRDWIHVDDIVDGVLAALARDVQGPVNLCTGRPTSFDELARMVCAEAGYEPTLNHREEEPTGVQYRVGDPTKMLSFYTPKVTLEEGIQRAFARLASQ